MNDWQKNNPQETRGWEIVKELNEKVGANPVMQGTSLACRRFLAEYFKLGTSKPSRLHSAILSCAVKMALMFPDFRFVPFLEMWGLENLRPEDSETKISDDGKRFPSLVEKMTKAYAYSLLFHPAEHLRPELERIMKPTLQKKGYRLEEKEGHLQTTFYAIATRVFTSDVRNRKMTFVSLLTPWGEDIVTEVHTITQFNRIRYEAIANRMFRVILRTTDNGNLRIEASCIGNENIEDQFATSVGFVEHIDDSHHHIHIYDNESRHMVENYGLTNSIKEGDYVRFVPVIPKEGSFKSAIITSVLQNGREAFGLRNVQVTYVSDNLDYCAWELLPDADGKVQPIVETGAKEVQEPATKGYINRAVAQKVMNGSNGFEMPKRGDKLEIITFLKRGKDGKKKPHVVWFKVMA